MTTVNIYSKEQTDALLAGKQGALTASDGVAITNGNIAHTNAVTPDTTGAGSATQIPVFTYDAQGHITGVTPTTVSATNDVDGNAIKTTYMKVADFHTVGGTYSDQNPVTTQTFVNSSIATNTANFVDTYDVVTDLGLTTSATEQQVVAALNTHTASLTLTNNDYCFVHFDSTQSAPSRYDRYKYVAGTPTWAFEYTLNNSGFTAVQWEAINSGINTTKVSTYDGYATTIAGKQADMGITALDQQGSATGSIFSSNSSDTAVPSSKAIYSAINTLNSNVIHTTGNETKTGTLTLAPSSNEYVKQYIGGYNGFIVQDFRLTNRTAFPTESVTRRITALNVYNDSSSAYAGLEYSITPSTNKRELRLQMYNGTGFDNLTLINDTSGSYVTAPSRITNLSNDDIITKKNLEGSDHTFTGINKVPTPASNADDLQIVNNFYVNDSTGTVDNNLIHKDGSEVKEGSLVVDGYLSTKRSTTPIFNIITDKHTRGFDPTGLTNSNSYFHFKDKDGNTDATINSFNQNSSRQMRLLFSVYNTNQGQHTPDTPYANDVYMRMTMHAGKDGETFATLENQRAFNASNTNDIITVATLIQALQSYGLIP